MQFLLCLLFLCMCVCVCIFCILCRLHYFYVSRFLLMRTFLRVKVFSRYHFSFFLVSASSPLFYPGFSVTESSQPLSFFPLIIFIICFPLSRFHIQPTRISLKDTNIISLLDSFFTHLQTTLLSTSPPFTPTQKKQSSKGNLTL